MAALIESSERCCVVVQLLSCKRKQIGLDAALGWLVMLCAALRRANPLRFVHPLAGIMYDTEL